jgi:hypothetical protein
VFLNVRDQISHPYKTTYIIIALYKQIYDVNQGSQIFVVKGHAVNSEVVCRPHVENNICGIPDCLNYYVIFIVYIKFTNVTADRTLETHMLTKRSMFRCVSQDSAHSVFSASAYTRRVKKKCL